MRFFNTKFVSLTASLLVGLGCIGNAYAVPVGGNPNFTFDAINDSDYSNTIQNWFTNVLYIEAQSTGDYLLFASQEGDFTYWESPTQSYGGTNGIFNLYAVFDSLGVLQSGLMAIAGRVPGVGINDPDILMSADLVAGDFTSSGNMMGFGINNIVCATQIQSECVGPTVTESVYFYTPANLPDIASLNGNNYQTTLATITTVPVPASIWLMISALSLTGALARRKRSQLRANTQTR
jgi:hypothetical protein